MSGIAERLGVSVQPVREALQQLEGEGLVEMIPNHGARVRSIDAQRMVHIHEIGEALSPTSLDNLPKKLPCAAFHRQINFDGGNQEGLDIIQRYSHLSLTLLNTWGRTRAYADRVLQEHHQLLDAIKRRDGEAAARIAGAHVRGTMNDVLEAVRGTSRR